MPSVKNAEREVDTASEDITTGYSRVGKGEFHP